MVSQPYFGLSSSSDPPPSPAHHQGGSNLTRSLITDLDALFEKVPWPNNQALEYAAEFLQLVVPMLLANYLYRAVGKVWPALVKELHLTFGELLNP